MNKKKVYLILAIIIGIVMIHGSITLSSMNESMESTLNHQSKITITEQGLADDQIYNAVFKYNQSVKEYNTLIRKFPNNIYAKIFGFDKRPYFNELSSK